MVSAQAASKTDVRIYLGQVQKLNAVIKNKLIEVSQLRSLALNITANMDGERVQSSGSQQKTADMINRYLDAENEVDNLVDRLIETRAAVIKTIEQVDNPYYYDLLHRFYIQFQTLGTIADELGKSYDSVKKAKNRAEKCVQAILDKQKEEAI